MAHLVPIGLARKGLFQALSPAFATRFRWQRAHPRQAASRGFQPPPPSPSDGRGPSESSTRLTAGPLCLQHGCGAGHLVLLACVFQGFLRLRAAHTALEEEYLRACRELPSAPQLVDSQGTPRKFDPSRYVLGRQAQRDRWAKPWVPAVTGSKAFPSPNLYPRGTETKRLPISSTPKQWDTWKLRFVSLYALQ